MNTLSKIALPKTAFQLGLYFLIEKQPDLLPRQLGVLIKCAEGRQTVRGLAAAFNASKPVVTRATDKLVELDMVRREVDQKDRRSVNISITPKGSGFLRKLYKKMEA